MKSILVIGMGRFGTYLALRLTELGNQVMIADKDEDKINRLSHNGADEVVYPERDLAYKTAIRFNADNIFDFIQLGTDYGVFEIKVPREWVGKDVVRANVRKEYGLNVLAVKKGDSSFALVSGDYIFESTDHVIVAGAFKNVDRLKD